MTSRQKLELALRAAEERKAQSPVALDLTKLTLIADYFLICHGTSDTHVRAIAEALRERFREASLRPQGCEGFHEAEWILLDYGDVVVHIFDQETRDYYELERVWRDARRLEAGAPA